MFKISKQARKRFEKKFAMAMSASAEPQVKKLFLDLFPTYNEKEDDLEEYGSTIEAVITFICGIWLYLPETEHAKDCPCCFTLKTAGLPFNELFDKTLTVFDSKRVSKRSFNLFCSSFLKTVTSTDPEEPFCQLKDLLKKFIKDDINGSGFLDITEHSSHLSDNDDIVTENRPFNMVITLASDNQLNTIKMRLLGVNLTFNIKIPHGYNGFMELCLETVAKKCLQLIAGVKTRYKFCSRSENDLKKSYLRLSEEEQSKEFS